MKRKSNARRKGLNVDVIIEHDDWYNAGNDIVKNVSGAARQAYKAAKGSEGDGLEVAVLLTNDQALARLNKQYRGKQGPTNVLSFQNSTSPLSGHLGDIAIAYETVMTEAQDQSKTPSAHLMHLVVHGLLHLLGYDHMRRAEAEKMEALERSILSNLGVDDPYRMSLQR